jgi:transposase
MAFYSVRSDRLFCEQLDYNLLFRWFLDMDMVEEPVAAAYNLLRISKLMPA